MLFPVKKLPAINSADQYLVASPQTSEVAPTSSYPLLLKYHNLSESASAFNSPCYLVEHCQPSSEAAHDLYAPLDWESDTVYSRITDFDELVDSVNMDDPDSILNYGLIGLYNVENSCYLNSVIQCLRFTYPLLAYITKKEYVQHLTGNSPELVQEFSRLVSEMWNSKIGRHPIYPTSFLQALQKFAPEFDGRTQEDAQELLIRLLSGLHDRLNSGTNIPTTQKYPSDTTKSRVVWQNYLQRENSSIVKMFVGQLRSTLICTHCCHTSATFDPFWDLSLPIPKSTAEVTTIEQCLSACFNDERIEGEDMPFCTYCKMNQACRKQMTIHKLPQILILHLKRFTEDQKKLDNMVVYPVDDLDLSPFCSAVMGSTRYNLYAVVNHSGSFSYGHYTAFCQHSFSNLWFEFNDHKVCQMGSPNDVVSDKAYILFYQRVSRSSSKL